MKFNFTTYFCFAVLSFTIPLKLASAAEKIRLFVDDDSPRLFLSDKNVISGEIASILVEVTNAAPGGILLQQSSWNRAYVETSKNANTCLAPMARTSARENEFLWIGPLYKIPYGLYALKGSPIQAKNIRELEGSSLRVGTILNEVTDSLCTK